MTKPLQVINGEREELENKLVELIFTPGPTPEEFTEIIATLDKRATLTVIDRPILITQDGQ
jgi:hypothetical protein